MAAHKCFRDVVSFDTTYITNKYDLLFALFVVVNHHRQTILLDYGLLSMEDTNTFVWLFKIWFHCMSSKAPQRIVIDQYKAMQNTIGVVFLEARHKWCLCHIVKKFPEKQKGHIKYKEIICALTSIVYDSLTVVRFFRAVRIYSSPHLYWLRMIGWLHYLVNIKGGFLIKE